MSAKRRWRLQFRAALEIAAKEYFAPLGENFDVSTYVEEYGVGARVMNSGLKLSPIRPEHQKLLSWSNRRAAATSEAPAHYTPVAREAQVPVARQQKTTVVDVVPIAVHAGVDLAQLRAHLTYNGLDLSTVSDGALRAAIDAVFSLTDSISNPQALAAHSITKKPSLLGITAPASTQKATTPSAPTVKCPVHTMDITGKVCSGCAAELKATSTTAAEAQICWDSIKNHLNYLADTYGTDTSAEKVKYSGFAAARGASVNH